MRQAARKPFVLAACGPPGGGVRAERAAPVMKSKREALPLFFKPKNVINVIT